jgi:hypothetical protein
MDIGDFFERLFDFRDKLREKEIRNEIQSRVALIIKNSPYYF